MAVHQGGVRGTLIDQAGNPVSGACVMALFTDGAGGSGNVTEGDGTYQLNIAVDQEAKIMVNDCLQMGVVQEWYADVATEAEATPVRITAGSFTVVDMTVHVVPTIERTVSLAGAAGGEGTLLDGSASLEATLSRPNYRTTTNVHLVAVPGTADAGDYRAVDRWVIFKPGQTELSVAISFAGDLEPEADETFSVVIDRVSTGTAVADGTAQMIIVDDDLLALPALPV
ncbi:MAG TPA: Calx-beta domain-containing protein [Acidimicrobiales bacterium]|nr:Calx-beta domain-containing protein [Acidimicrobiales bacterium]